jgi:hypothetical protein
VNGGLSGAVQKNDRRAVAFEPVGFIVKAAIVGGGEKCHAKPFYWFNWFNRFSWFDTERLFPLYQRSNLDNRSIPFIELCHPLRI